MKTLKTVPGQNLVLGHRGENLATRIIFSIAPLVETYGPGTAHLLHQRQGDSEPYPVATLQEGMVRGGNRKLTYTEDRPVITRPDGYCHRAERREE